MPMSSSSKERASGAGVQMMAAKAIELFASRFRLVVRDSSGNELTMNSSGAKWLKEHSITSDHALRPGEAVGLVFPVAEMFDLRPNFDYSCLLVLTAENAESPPWVAAPIKLRVEAEPSAPK